MSFKIKPLSFNAISEKLIKFIEGWSMSCEIALRWMPPNLISDDTVDSKSILV